MITWFLPLALCMFIDCIWFLPLGLCVCSDEAHWFARFELSMYPQNEISLAVVHLFVVFLNLVYRNFRGVCVLCVSACLSVFIAELIYNFLCFIFFWIWCWDSTGPCKMSLVVFPSCLLYRTDWGTLMLTFLKGLSESISGSVLFWTVLVGDCLSPFTLDYMTLSIIKSSWFNNRRSDMPRNLSILY